LVAHAYLPDSHAGVEVYTSRLASELVRRGRDVAVMAARLRPGGAQYALEESEVEGIPTFGVVQNWPYRGLPEALDDPAVDRLFGHILDRVRPDLVAVQTLAGLSLGIFEVAHRRGVPIVVHLHDGWWSCPSGGQRLHADGTNCLPVDRRRCGECFARFRGREGPVEAWSRRAAGRLPAWVPPDALHRTWNRLPEGARRVVRDINEAAARRTRRPASESGDVDPAIAARATRVTEVFRGIALALSPTRFLAASLALDGVAAARTVIVPTGVPRPSEPAKREAGAGDGPLRVTFLGTWVPHKGVAVLADALASLPDDVASSIDARAHGPVPFSGFHDDVLTRANGRLRDGGVVAPSGVSEVLDAADVVVVPSTWAENAPLVALEARARGRVVLASDLGGLPELVSEATGGRLLEGGSSIALAQALRELASDRGEVRRRAALSRAAPPRDVKAWVDDVEAAWAGVGAEP
jgi:glycosyltransferase involved in cell wall biosynthesis